MTYALMRRNVQLGPGECNLSNKYTITIEYHAPEPIEFEQLHLEQKLQRCKTLDERAQSVSHTTLMLPF